MCIEINEKQITKINKSIEASTKLSNTILRIESSKRQKYK